jgi:hypothetical protein
MPCPRMRVRPRPSDRERVELVDVTRKALGAARCPQGRPAESDSPETQPLTTVLRTARPTSPVAPSSENTTPSRRIGPPPAGTRVGTTPPTVTPVEGTSNPAPGSIRNWSVCAPISTKNVGASLSARSSGTRAAATSRGSSDGSSQRSRPPEGPLAERERKYPDRRGRLGMAHEVADDPGHQDDPKTRHETASDDPTRRAASDSHATRVPTCPRPGRTSSRPPRAGSRCAWRRPRRRICRSGATSETVAGRCEGKPSLQRSQRGATGRTLRKTASGPSSAARHSVIALRIHSTEGRPE